ncbi:MAG: preprotein translocase subunit SecG [SAR202 cluster bacterium]|nr:preprotein translocase subunit SecG [Dehalococcoidia bacterium]MBA13171.1 preprotein translocase subunit SecG [Chloroflexota bacterium]MQG23143.1 preprotein translocase subunit SecG [SAR202 cluster bacterium]|tara:strand:- start:762 stop:986 length:225 start_codon:yes stop_codon:yes gene_type:complete
MGTIFNIAMIIISILLIAIILIQVRGQGSALFGAAESSYRTRRGLELALFRLTIFLSVVFVIVAIISAWVVTNN